MRLWQIRAQAAPSHLPLNRLPHTNNLSLRHAAVNAHPRSQSPSDFYPGHHTDLVMVSHSRAFASLSLCLSQPRSTLYPVCFPQKRNAQDGRSRVEQKPLRKARGCVWVADAKVIPIHSLSELASITWALAAIRGAFAYLNGEPPLLPS